MPDFRKFLILNLEGGYGFFKKPETTTSPISYYFPPRPTLLGIICAICGFDKDIYHNDPRLSSENCVMAVKIIGRIGSFFYNTNTVEFSGSLIDKRAPTNYTYLKEPKYTVYINVQDETLYKELRTRLENNDFFYNVSLGLANLLARVTYVGEKRFEKLKKTELTGEPIEISTVIAFKRKRQESAEVTFLPGEILKTTMPRIMDKNREIMEFASYVYERNGQPIKLIVSQDFEIYAGVDDAEKIVGL